MSQPLAQNQLHIDQHYYGAYPEHEHVYPGKCAGCIRWEEHRKLCDKEWLEFVRQVKAKHAKTLEEDELGFPC